MDTNVGIRARKVEINNSNAYDSTDANRTKGVIVVLIWCSMVYFNLNRLCESVRVQTRS